MVVSIYSFISVRAFTSLVGGTLPGLSTNDAIYTIIHNDTIKTSIKLHTLTQWSKDFNPRLKINMDVYFVGECRGGREGKAMMDEAHLRAPAPLQPRKAQEHGIITPHT